MRAFNSFFPLRRWAAVALLLSLFWMTVLPQAAVVANTPAKTQEQLVIASVSYPQTTVCVGDQETFKVLITSEVVSGTLAPLTLAGIPKAIVDANTYDHPTNQMGYATWAETAKQPGEIPWIITATKDGYLSADPVRFKVKVVKCGWKIGLDYDDEFYDQAYVWHYQSSVELPDYVSFAADENGNLALVDGGSLVAKYEGNVYYFVAQAFHCNIDPSLSGDYSIQFSGSLKNNRLTIKLFAIPVALPIEVNIQCVDDHGALVWEPFKYPTIQRLDLITRSIPSLASLIFNQSGGVKKFKLKGSLIWGLPAHNAGGIVVVVRDKGE
jgi:hypothetical protein